MNILTKGRSYELWQLGGGTQTVHLGKKPGELGGIEIPEILFALIDRTEYLNRILPCNETGDALIFLQMALSMYTVKTPPEKKVTVAVEGHIYEIRGHDDLVQTLTFVRRSGGAITYPTEWPGTQVQEVLRMIIIHTRIISNKPLKQEVSELLTYLRNAIYMYEARADRRKKEDKNTTDGRHDDTERPRGWRYMPFPDVPFTPDNIEDLPIGEDGHIIC